MSQYEIGLISRHDRAGNRKLLELLQKEGIERDGNLDYTIGLYEGEKLVGTGSCFMNSLRCLAVDSDYQGEGLLNKIITHLIEFQFSRGNKHLFLYTKCDKAKFFESLGFFEIARVEGKVVFMENKRNGFANYLENLDEIHKEGKKVSALIMNCNPFTNGHKYLVEKASTESEVLHLFVVSEDISLVPFAVRKELIIKGTSHLDNIIYHDTGDYLISSSTFPSYFLKDASTVSRSHAQLDLAIFGKIAQALGITHRYVGEEKASEVTAIYNEVMAEELPKFNVKMVTVPRKEENNAPISASTVRMALKNGDFESLKALVPPTTYDFFKSAQAQVIIEKIKASDNIIHH